MTDLPPPRQIDSWHTAEENAAPTNGGPGEGQSRSCSIGLVTEVDVDPVRKQVSP